LLAFILFLYLLLGTRQETRTFLPQDLFFLADPLAGIGAMLASRSWIMPMIIGAAALLVITLIFGRAWCGWLCPLGAIIDWMPSKRVSRKNLDTPAFFWKQGKYLTLLIIVFGAALGSLTLIILDPITLLFRSMAAVVIPLLNSLFLFVDERLYSIELIQSGVTWFDTSVRIHLLGEPGFYLPNLTVLLLFVGVLALNMFRKRAWCRYLCPLGGLLGLVSKVSLVRHQIDAGKCIACRPVRGHLSTGAIDPGRSYAAILLSAPRLDCVGNCPTHAISFPIQAGFNKEYQPEKRQSLMSLGLAAVGAFVLRFAPSSSRNVPKLIRPPGATEESLANKCVRCGECVKVCPTAAIQPTISAGAWDTTWSPHLELRRGYCDYSCNACGQVCPTGAIAKMSLEEKRKEVIGVAVIDKERCIPFAKKKACIVCEEMCPLPQKAIKLKTEKDL
jgi:polyferredoxin